MRPSQRAHTGGARWRKCSAEKESSWTTNRTSLETLEELLDVCLIDKAPNFETAKKFLDKTLYDAAILDIMGVRGYDLLKLCREKHVPALMLTAHALSPDNLIKSIKGGALAYIPKDRITDIGTFLAEMLQARQEGAPETGAVVCRPETLL